MKNKKNHSTIKKTEVMMRKLGKLLMEPTRALMFSEFILHPEGISTKKLAHYIDKNRTTVNFHLKKFIDAGLIVENEELQENHTRGKPTVYYKIKKQFRNLKFEKNNERDKTENISKILSSITSHLSAFSGIAKRSNKYLLEGNLPTSSKEIDFKVLILSQKEIEIFSKHIKNAFESAMDEINDQPLHSHLSEDKENEMDPNYLLFCGHFPILRK